MVYIQQNIVCEIIDSFYNWLIVMSEKDCNELKLNRCQDFQEEYKNIIKDLLKKHKFIRNNIRYKQLNTDSVRRLKIIIEATKEEYKAISDIDEKDMGYFNSLLGWYETIPNETDMFIDSLFNRQLKK